MRIFNIVIIILGSLFFISCSVKEIREKQATMVDEKKGIVFIRSLRNLEDFGVKPSIFKRLWRAIVGGEEESPLSFPMDIAIADGVFAIADPGVNGVHIIDSRKNRYIKIKKACGKELLSPVSIDFLSDGSLLFSDSGIKLICVVNMVTCEETLIKKDFAQPVGVAHDEDDNIYVIDSHLHRLFIFNKNGEEIHSIWGRGSCDSCFNFPTYLDYRDGKIFVMDTLSYSVKIFAKNGEFLSKFGKAGDGTGDFGKPKGIAVDKTGNIHVADSLFDVVQIFDPSGNFLTWYGGPGEGDGLLLNPVGIFVTNNEIFIANSFNSRIEVFGYEME